MLTTEEKVATYMAGREYVYPPHKISHREDGSDVIPLIYKLTTTDSTIHKIASVPVPNNSCGFISAKIIAWEPTVPVKYYYFWSGCFFRNDVYGLSFYGGIAAHASLRSDSNYSYVLSNSEDQTSIEISVRANKAPAVTVYWKALVEYSFVGVA